MAHSRLQEAQGVRLAVEGCGHGTLHSIYASVAESCKQKGWPSVDLVIIGGDFQAVRNAYDLNCVSMPAKYRDMCDFHEYYSGQRIAPYLTVFVGGNHEASNYLLELYYGGWVAPNIYYAGAANVLRLGPLRFAGMSGIWKGFDYRKPHFERLPFNESDMKSVYHVRELDVRKLQQVRTQVDIGVSHDWPQGIEWKGNWQKLFSRKKHFVDDARTGRLGSVAAKQVLERLRPRFWFSAHLHCKYAAVVDHQKEGNAQNGASKDDVEIESGMNAADRNNEHHDTAAKTKNDDEIDLDLEEDDELPTVNQTDTNSKAAANQNADEIDLELDDRIEAKGTGLEAKSDGIVPLDAARAALPSSFKRQETMEHPPEISNTITQFLALDKCLPNRDFLQIIEIPTDASLDELRPLKLEYDREWLAITRAFALAEPPAFGDPNVRVLRAKTQAEYRALIEKQRSWVDENIQESEMTVPQNFTITAPVYDGGNWNLPQYQPNGGGLREYPSPQTAKFCELLGIENPLAMSEEEANARMTAGPRVDREAARVAELRQNSRGGYGGRGGRGGRGGWRGGGRGGGRGRNR